MRQKEKLLRRFGLLTNINRKSCEYIDYDDIKNILNKIGNLKNVDFESIFNDL